MLKHVDLNFGDLIYAFGLQRQTSASGNMYINQSGAAAFLDYDKQDPFNTDTQPSSLYTGWPPYSINTDKRVINCYGNLYNAKLSEMQSFLATSYSQYTGSASRGLHLSSRAYSQVSTSQSNLSLNKTGLMYINVDGLKSSGPSGSASDLSMTPGILLILPKERLPHGH